MALGSRIRQTRNLKAITLQELSDRSGLSKGFICQLENDKASPSLQALEKLASALGVSIAYLFLTPEEKIHVVREAERQNYLVGTEGPLIQLLSASRRALKMIIVQLPPGASIGGENHAHDGEECQLVLDGEVKCTQGEESVVLTAGDALHWNGFIPHRVENCGQVPARVLVVSSGAIEEMLECNECEDINE